MKKYTFIVIILLLCGVALAAVDSELKRRAAQGLPYPTADGSFSEFDRGMIAGVYVAGADTGATTTGSSILIWYHHHH